MANNYRLGLYEKAMPNHLTWLEKLQCVKDCGYDYLEISIDESDARLSRLTWTEQEKNELKEAMAKTQVPILSMCLSGHRKYPLGSLDLSIQQRSLEIMQQAINFAEEFKIRIIQLAGYDVYYEQGNLQTKENFKKNLAKATKMASLKGIMLGFETMETPFMDTVAKAMEYVNYIKSPYLNVYPDIGNLKNSSVLYHHQVNDDLKSGAGHLVAAHLKETVPGKYREIPFGTGHSEFLLNIECLNKLKVSLFVAEFWYVNQVDWYNDIIQANKFLRAKLDQVF